MPLDSLPRTPSPVTLNASIDTPVGETLTHDGTAVLLGQALRDVIAERLAQVDQHGHTLTRDQHYHPAALPFAAIAYAQDAIMQIRTGGGNVEPPSTWPWPTSSWRPHDPRTNLVKAAALIWAALDRLDHAPADASDDRIAA